MTNRNIKISLLALVFLLPVSYALASTTISTDITTGGTLTVGSTTATSTFANSINLLNGCFSINGTCLSSGSATTPGGASSTVQFNANGSFGGNSNFTFDGSYLNLGSGIGIKVGGATLLDSSGNLNAAVIPKSDTQANLASFVPALGERVYATDDKKTYVGDGSTAVSGLFPNNLFSKNGSVAYYNTTTFGDLEIGNTPTPSDSTWGFQIIGGATPSVSLGDFYENGSVTKIVMFHNNIQLQVESNGVLSYQTGVGLNLSNADGPGWLYSNPLPGHYNFDNSNITFSGAVGVGTTTPSANANMTLASGSTATTTGILIGTPKISGGRIVFVDSVAGHATCTELSTNGGVGYFKVTTCPAQ